MILSLGTFYRVMHNAGMFFTQEEWTLFQTSAMDFLTCYQWLSLECKIFIYLLLIYFFIFFVVLSLECEKSHNKLYNIVPKFHYMYHLVQQARYMNPRFVWCYGGEDLVGRASSLAHSCTRGTPPSQVPSKMMDKYSHAKHMEWSRHWATITKKYESVATYRPKIK